MLLCVFCRGCHTSLFPSVHTTIYSMHLKHPTISSLYKLCGLHIHIWEMLNTQLVGWHDGRAVLSPPNVYSTKTKILWKFLHISYTETEFVLCIYRYATSALMVTTQSEIHSCHHCSPYYSWGHTESVQQLQDILGCSIPPCDCLSHCNIIQVDVGVRQYFLVRNLDELFFTSLLLWYTQ